MSASKLKYIVAIGNVYVETNYIDLVTDDPTILKVGKEYRAKKYEVRLGGSVVNFAVQSKRLSVNVGLIGKIGNDEPGKKLLHLLEEEGIAPDLIKVSRDRTIQTSIDTGLIFADGNNIQVVSGNANQSLSLKDIDLTNTFFAKSESVYVGGFLKQTSLYPDYPTLFRKLTHRGKRIFLDHGRIPVDVTDKQLNILYKSMKFVEVYFPNKDELVGITKESSIENALKRALEMGPKLVAVKLGPEGCRIKTKNEETIIPGYKVKAISTVGAGDAFNAGFITQYLAGEPLQKAGKFANAVAALRVSTNRNPQLEEVNNFIDKNN